jgi:hypothetical protein
MLHRQLPALALALGIFAALPAAAADDVDDFAASYAQAEANARTEAGGQFDFLLGASLQNDVVMTAVTECVRLNPGPQDVRGYFQFRSATEYEVVLAPGSAFATCLASALEGRAVPAPPSVPYLNPFTFSFDPEAQASTP